MSTAALAVEESREPQDSSRLREGSLWSSDGRRIVSIVEWRGPNERVMTVQAVQAAIKSVRGLFKRKVGQKACGRKKIYQAT